MALGRRVPTAAALLFFVAVATGCAGAVGGLTPSASVTTTIQGWEQWLRLDWTSETKPNGHELHGYIYSRYGAPIYEVRLLAQGLDAEGNVIGQKIEWVPGIVPGLQRTQFRISGLRPVARYRVSVWSFETIEGQGFL